MRTWCTKAIKILMLCCISSVACADLNTSINHLIQEQYKQEKIGVYVQNLATGDVLYSYNGETPMTPASTTKAFTAAAAFLALGPDYRFDTTLSTNAKITPILKGNVYLHFSGDPTLTSLNINSLIYQMREKGIRTIEGNVILDETVFTGPAYAAGWGNTDFENCYGAPITGAIINSDCSRFGVIKLPDLYAERTVRFALRNAGIRIHGQVIEGTTPINTTLIAAHYSNPLQNILAYMLKYSDDVYANAIFKTVGEDYYHTGSYTSGALATHNILVAHFGKLFSSILLRDGSGLSTENLISPEQLVALYRDMYNDDNLRLPFMKSLAISGQSGTLVFRLTDRLLRGHVFAKTGTFEHDKGGVSNLAGYLILPNHDPIAFAVMTNNNAGDAGRAEFLQDQVVRLIAQNELTAHPQTAS